MERNILFRRACKQGEGETFWTCSNFQMFRHVSMTGIGAMECGPTFELILLACNPLLGKFGKTNLDEKASLLSTLPRSFLSPLPPLLIQSRIPFTSSHNPTDCGAGQTHESLLSSSSFHHHLGLRRSPNLLPSSVMDPGDQKVVYFTHITLQKRHGPMT